MSAGVVELLPAATRDAVAAVEALSPAEWRAFRLLAVRPATIPRAEYVARLRDGRFEVDVALGHLAQHRWTVDLLGVECAADLYRWMRRTRQVTP